MSNANGSRNLLDAPMVEGSVANTRFKCAKSRCGVVENTCTCGVITREIHPSGVETLGPDTEYTAVLARVKPNHDAQRILHFVQCS